MTDSGYQQYPYQYPPSRSTSSKAVTAMVLGIISLVVCQIVGIAAIIVGNQARREIRASGEEGDGMALAGVILGWVAIGLLALVALVVIVLVIIGAAASTTG